MRNGGNVGRLNSHTTSRPPGRVTRAISARAAAGSTTLRSPNEIVTASNTASANGNRVPSPAVNGSAGPRLLPDGEHAERQVARHHDRAEVGERLARRPGAGSQVEHPVTGLRVDGPHHRASPPPVLPHRQHVVGQVVAGGHRVEHRRHLVGPLVEGGAGHAHTLPRRGRPDLRTLLRVTTAVPDAGAYAPLVVRTTELTSTATGSLLDLLPSDEPVAWVRRGEGLVGWGVAAQVRTSGPDRFEAAEAWWREALSGAAVRDEVGVPGSGLVAFGSFGFADDPGDSVLVVPKVVVGQRRQAGRMRRWVTVVGSGQLPPAELPVASSPPVAPRGLRYADGALDGAQWAAAVEEAVRRIGAGGLEKVVLARDLIAQAEAPVDVRWPLQRLASSYSGCWTYHVDGLVGATPEMLVRRERGLVTSRVLAGTIRRTGDDQHDLALAGALARSSKDLEEHEYAVRSVAEALAPHCSSMNVPEAPFVLHLPNVMHLATDVTGVLDAPSAEGTGALSLAASLHPSAAVGGTPTTEALAAITELEQMPRGRYAGPVGWIDADGDGEWGLALRCGQVAGDRVRLFAGCGIVAGSQAEAELAEAQAKLVPVRDALSG